MNIDLRVFDTVSSTNDVLIDMVNKGAKEGSAVLAWTQTAGRGRLGRTFISPKGGIYLSVLLPMEDSMLLTAKVSVAVRRAIQKETGKRVYIKWVNDIIYNDKKVAGILTQVYRNYAVVGIGINFSTQIKDFPPELQKTAISLYRYSGEAECEELDVVNSLLKEIEVLFSDSSLLWIGEYKNASMLIGKKVTVIQADKVAGTGTVLGVDDFCHLHVEINGEERELSTGEVSVRF